MGGERPDAEEEADEDDDEEEDDVCVFLSVLTVFGFDKSWCGWAAGLGCETGEAAEEEEDEEEEAEEEVDGGAGQGAVADAEEEEEAASGILTRSGEACAAVLTECGVFSFLDCVCTCDRPGVRKKRGRR